MAMGDEPISDVDDAVLVEADSALTDALSAVALEIRRLAAAPPRRGRLYLITGGPGMGTSTALRYLCRRIAGGAPGGAAPAPRVDVVEVSAVMWRGLTEAEVRAELGVLLCRRLDDVVIARLAEQVLVARGETSLARSTDRVVLRGHNVRTVKRALADPGDLQSALGLVGDALASSAVDAVVFAVDDLHACSPDARAAIWSAVDTWLQCPGVFAVATCPKREVDRLHGRPRVVELGPLATARHVRRAFDAALLVEGGSAEAVAFADHLAAGDILAPLLPPAARPRELSRAAIGDHARHWMAHPEFRRPDRGIGLKLWVISRRWPSFYSSQLAPFVASAFDPAAGNEPSGDGAGLPRMLRTLVDAGDDALDDLGRELGLKRKEVRRLVAYLRTPPLLDEAALTSARDQRPAPAYPTGVVGDGPARSADEAVGAAEDALAAGDVELATSILTTEVVPRAGRLRAEHATTLGRAAVVAERAAAADLAWTLYRAAIDVSPGDSALLAYAVDFVAGASEVSAAQAEIGMAWADTARALLRVDPRGPRLAMLLRFYERMGRVAAADEVRAALVASARSETAADELEAVLAVLHGHEDVPTLEQYVAALAGSTPDPVQRVGLLQRFADHCAVLALEGAPTEALAVALYADLLGAPQTTAGTRERIAETLEVLADARGIELDGPSGGAGAGALLDALGTSPAVRWWRAHLTGRPGPGRLATLLRRRANEGRSR